MITIVPNRRLGAWVLCTLLLPGAGRADPLPPDLGLTAEEIYARHTGKTPDEVHEDMERDRFFKADQAMEYGLIDRVIDQH